MKYKDEMLNKIFFHVVMQQKYHLIVRFGFVKINACQIRPWWICYSNP